MQNKDKKQWMTQTEERDLRRTDIAYKYTIHITREVKRFDTEY